MDRNILFGTSRACNRIITGTLPPDEHMKSYSFNRVDERQYYKVIELRQKRRSMIKEDELCALVIRDKRNREYGLKKSKKSTLNDVSSDVMNIIISYIDNNNERYSMLVNVFFNKAGTCMINIKDKPLKICINTKNASSLKMRDYILKERILNIKLFLSKLPNVAYELVHEYKEFEHIIESDYESDYSDGYDYDGPYHNCINIRRIEYDYYTFTHHSKTVHSYSPLENL